MTEPAAISWPSSLCASRDRIYESLAPLYCNDDESIGLIVSCSVHGDFKKDEPRGLLHKVEIDNLVNLDEVRIGVTHEVNPNLDSCGQIVTANEKLLFAGFNDGSVMPITNFGYKKTFHSNVAGCLRHHEAPVNCVASNSSGSTLASGCTQGRITIYNVVDQTNLEFLTRTENVTNGLIITDLSFIHAQEGVEYKPFLPFSDTGSEHILMYSTSSGQLCLLDTRCKLAHEPSCDELVVTDGRVGISKFCFIKSKPKNEVYLGTVQGRIYGCDIRMGRDFLRMMTEQHFSDDGTILRMREIVVKDGHDYKRFLAYCNGSDRIRIIDLETMYPDSRWKCIRAPGAKVRDLIQVGNKIITCGDKTSIGIWVWDG